MNGLEAKNLSHWQLYICRFHVYCSLVTTIMEYLKEVYLGHYLFLYVSNTVNAVSNNCVEVFVDNTNLVISGQNITMLDCRAYCCIRPGMYQIQFYAGLGDDTGYNCKTLYLCNL